MASDAKILGLSIGGENILKIEVAVLFPSVEGQVPEPVPRATLDQVLQKNEESLGVAIGGTIIRIGNNILTFIALLRKKAISQFFF